MGTILDGKALAKLKADKLKEKVKILKEKGINPLFCVINIGENPASQVYIRSKGRLAKKIGIEQKLYQLPTNTQESEVAELIKKLNADPSVDGMMIQLPVPEQINITNLMEIIDPSKDVDGLTPANSGRLWQGHHFVEPATPDGIIALIDRYQIDLEGKNVVVIGRSDIVGKPIAALALERNATVTILHSKTQNPEFYLKHADVIISAVGQANLIKADMIKEGAVIVDVGINHVDGHLVGDVDFDDVKNKAGWITPVPGGVGPLTVEFLMEQVVKLARRRNDRK